MRSTLILGAVAVALVLLLVWQESRLRRAVEQSRREVQAAVDSGEALQGRIHDLEGKLAVLQAGASDPSSTLAPGQSTSDALTRVAVLENQVRQMRQALGSMPLRPSVPEYDPLQPESADLPEEQAQASPSTRRSWGEEQIIGPPDVERSGDVPTAWASREADGGPEWLAAGFARSVEIAEVRIRESYNPGAITKVTAMVGGQELVLWEGSARSGAAPRDFVIRPPFSVSAGSVVVHLDTSLVTGWNEIDAVELVGRDGTRQWANSSSASSSYATRTGAQGFEGSFLVVPDTGIGPAPGK